MIQIGLTKVDFALLLENWELQAVYSEKTAMRLKKELEMHAEKFFLEKKGNLKVVKIRFFELGLGCRCWVETFCNFKFTFLYNDDSEREGVLDLKVQAIINNGCHINMSLQEE